MNKITVIGSSNTDMVIKSSRLPAPGETIIGGDFLMNPGGKGANQAVAAARLGGDTTFITKTGNDIFGKQAFQTFEREGIHTEYIATDPIHPSGVALIMVDNKGENCISVALGSNGTLNQQDIDRAAEQITSSEVVLMQLEIPLDIVEYAAKMASQAGAKVVLNPAPAQELSGELLSTLYLLTPNETEAEMLTGIKVNDKASASKAAVAIKALGVKNVIITMGASGAFVSTDTEELMISVPRVQAVDTTAAGDKFNGALVVALAEQRSFVEAVHFANKAASISVTKLGAQASVPYRKDIL
jgi:ribokinase